MSSKVIGARISDSTWRVVEDIKNQHGMTDSDITRLMIMFSITHQVEFQAYIDRAKKYCEFGKDKEKYEEAE